MKKILNFSCFTCLIVWIFLLFNFDASAQDEIIPNWINVAHGPFNLVEPPDVINDYAGNEDCVALIPKLKSGHGHYWNDVPTDVEYRSLIEYNSNPN